MTSHEVDLSALEETRERASALLRPLTSMSRSERLRWMGRVRPLDEDWGVVFTDDAAAKARERYREMWLHPEAPEPGEGQSEVLVTGVIPAQMLATENAASRQHPGGFQSIAGQLRPDVIWVSWKFVRPASTGGVAYHGLARVSDDRFAWFPQPWVALACPPRTDLPRSRVQAVTMANLEDLVRRHDIFVFCCEPGDAPRLRPHLEQLAGTEFDVGFGFADTTKEPALVDALAIRELPALCIVRDELPLIQETGARPLAAVAGLLERARSVDMAQVRQRFES